MIVRLTQSGASSELRSADRSTIANRIVFLACLLAVVLAALFPYFNARWTHPHEPASVSVLYRDQPGDIQYYPLISALSRGPMKEFMIKERLGSATHAFPVPGLLVHAVSYRLFGPYGYAVADVLIFAGFFSMLFVLMRVPGISVPTAAVVAMLFALGVYLIIDFHPLPQLIVRVWEQRIPRPFVSDVFALATLAVLAWIVRTPSGERSRGQWALLGATLALIIQLDVYAAYILLASVSVAIVTSGRFNRRLVENLGLMFAVLMILCVPFLIQRSFHSHAIDVRWGLFPVPRTHLLFWRPEIRIMIAAFLLYALFFAGAIIFKEDLDGIYGSDASLRFRRILLLFVAVTGFGHLAIPLTTFVLGKAVQIYHFPVIARDLDSMCCIVCLGAAADILFRIVARKVPAFSHFGWQSAALLAVVCLGGLGYKIHFDRSSPQNGYIRADSFPEIDGLSNTPYRVEFADLARHLKSLGDSKHMVLGTFDHELCAWWLTFNQGCSYLGDPFLSTVSDSEIEARFASFCHLLGVSPTEYASIIRQPTMNLFWISCDKYQASRAYTYAPLSDYSPTQRAEIAHTTILDNWHIAVPLSEQRRLLSAYESAPSGLRGELDVIVLTNEKDFRDHAPPASQWRLSYQSPRFRVYVPLSKPNSNSSAS